MGGFSGDGGGYLCHDGVFVDGVDAGLFDCLGEDDEFFVVVEFASVFETSCPCEDTND
jgi:hypothetical protein